MLGKNSILEGGQELSTISQEDFNYGSLFNRIIQSVNSLAKNLGGAAVGKLQVPPPVDSIQVQGAMSGNVVTAPSEILHFTLTHNPSIQKHIHYFSEIDTSPNFSQPHVFDHGTSRTGFITLPTFQNDGKTPNAYYLRSYAQYPGSDPVKPTVFGGLAGATKILMTGTSATTILSSTGSGTAAATGTQGGKGLGVDLVRPAPGPKRALMQ